MHIAQQRSRSDAEFYQMERLADSNKALLTPQYLELRKYESIAQNSKIFYGSDIPNMFVQGGCEGDKARIVAAVPSEQKVEPWIPSRIKFVGCFQVAVVCLVQYAVFGTAY